VIRDDATLAAIWSSRIGMRPPAVDFTQDQVVVAFGQIGTAQTVSVNRVSVWEDDELSVVVHTNSFGGTPTNEAAYSAVVTPKTYGPARFDVRDVTPRP
jgi:hypothetical protein